MEPIILTLSGGVSHQSEITLFKAGQILALISTPENQNIQPVKEISESRSFLSGLPRQSLIELVRDTKASTIPQKIIVAADYIMTRNSAETFNINDIKSEFRKIGLSPANFGRDLKVAISQGWIYESEHSGEYHLTATATEIISQEFAAIDQTLRTKKVTKKKSTLKKKKAAQNSTTTISPDVESLPISSEPEGMINYHAIPIKSDRPLWILVYADNNAVHGLSGKEISCLTGKIKGTILERDISSFMAKHIKSGSVIRDASGSYNVQQKGIDIINGMKNV